MINILKYYENSSYRLGEVVFATSPNLLLFT
ncbi:Uncharacterised protein [Clostridium paraputrificum]|uniref:Uncharacterized protein n=1 Tax=Clostridium paraputrificum TaxID=29363 RepID=A0A6N3G4Q4_9CLOT